MVQKLKRITSEADHHKVLDIFFILGAFIGFFNVLGIFLEYASGNFPPELQVYLFIFILMGVSGALGYRWHIKGEVYKEQIIIGPIIGGFIIALGGNFAKFVDLLPEDSYAPNLSGMAAGLSVFVCIEGIERIWKIRARKIQIKQSQEEQKRLPQRNPEEIAQKAAEVIQKIEA